MNGDWLHLLLKGLFKDHTWEWIVSFLKYIYCTEKGLDLIDLQCFIIPRFSNIHQFGDKPACMKQWTSAEFMHMVKVWLPAFACVHKGYLDHYKYIKSVTDFILIASYHSPTKTTLKYLQAVLRATSSNICTSLPYHKSHLMHLIPWFHSHIHCIEFIRVMAFANTCDTIISEVAHKHLTMDGDDFSNNVIYIPQILRWEMYLFHIKLRVSIPLHIIKSDPLLLKADICRKILVAHSLASRKLSRYLIPRIDGVISKHNTIATLTFPEGITISECINALTSYVSTFRVDTNASLDLWTSWSCALWILRQKIYQTKGITVTIQQHNTPDQVVVQDARYVKNWCAQGNWFNNISIHGNQAPHHNSWVHLLYYCPAKLLYTFHFSNRINPGEANSYVSGIQLIIRHNLLWIEGLEYPSSAMSNRIYQMIMCRDVPQ